MRQSLFVCHSSLSQGSLSLIVNEDSDIMLDLERVGGAFGLVTVAWELSGSHGDGEITPNQGTVRD